MTFHASVNSAVDDEPSSGQFSEKGRLPKESLNSATTSSDFSFPVLSLAARAISLALGFISWENNVAMHKPS